MIKDGLIEALYTLRTKCTENDGSIYEKLGLSPGEYNFFLSAMPLEKLECAPILKKMRISASRFSRIVDRMVKNGYLTRCADDNDRRNIVLSYTAKGESVINDISDRLIKLEAKLTENLSYGQIEEMKKFSEIISKNFE